MQNLLNKIKKLIPRKLFQGLQPIYHYLLATAGAIIYRFPSRQIKVVAVTGTKGKTSTVEYVNAVLEEAGYKTALAGTLRFKIGAESKANMYKMTMPGRFFIQRFLRQAVDANCDYAVVEISSEAVKQYRHKFIDLDALIFTNLAPEHIESHGSYDKYVAAKVKLAKALETSPKPNKVLVVNADDKESPKFLAHNIDRKITFSLNDVGNLVLSKDGFTADIGGETLRSEIPGKFTVYNMLAALKFGASQNIDHRLALHALQNISEIKGRVQKINAGQNFTVVVDYAHTAESLGGLYQAFGNERKICVLGNCGGGRDKWKRGAMAEMADKYCDDIILTDEDPYDDDPMEIIEDMAKHFTKHTPDQILSRRDAIRKAVNRATPGDVVLISGKGTDPYIMRKNGVKEPWSDATVAEEELKRLTK